MSSNNASRASSKTTTVVFYEPSPPPLYSGKSLAYLRRFPIDKLKIDIAFIRDVTTNTDDAAIALAIIRMAHSLKLEVIAEGVETAAQLAYLRHNRIPASLLSFGVLLNTIHLGPCL